MQVQSPLRCPSCGNAVDAGGGRCPICGYLLPRDLPRRSTAAGARSPRRRDGPATRRAVWIALFVVAAAAIAVIGVAAFDLGPLDDPSPQPTPIATPEPAAAPSASGPLDDPSRLEVSAFTSSATARAAAWHRDALLVSIEAFPVVKGRANVTGEGFVEAVYGRPSTTQLGPGAPLAQSRLVVRFDSGGLRQIKRTDARAGRGIADPNCPAEEVARVVIASGVPETTLLRLRYAASARHARPVWRASGTAPAHERVLDGQSCAVVAKPAKG